MHPNPLLKTAVAGSDPVAGIVSGMGALAAQTVYIILAVLLGIRLFRSGAFYALFQNLGEERKAERQTVNVIGTAVYFLIAVLLLPLAGIIGTKIFGG